MFEPPIMAASSLWQPLIFLRTRTCERLILFEPEVKQDLKASKICEGQIYLEPDLRASKICEGQIYLGPDFEPVLRASVLYGRKMSLEPDFKPESLF